MRNRNYLRSTLALSGVLTLALAQPRTEPGEVRLSSIAYRPPSQHTLKVDTRLVEIGVVVRDARGHSVAGFTKDDFEVTDESRKRDITAFSVESSVPVAPFGAAPSAEPAAGRPAEVAHDPVSPRYVALVFDDVGMQVNELALAQTAARRFLKDGLRAGDHIGLFTMSGTQNLGFTTDIPTLSGALGKLHLSGRTPDAGGCSAITPYEAYLIANRIDLNTFNVKIAETARCQGLHVPPVVTRWTDILPAPAPSVMGLANAIWQQVLQSSRASLFTIDHVVDALARMPAGRSILLASSGFLSGTLEQEMDAIIRHALHAGVVINSLDAKGLYTGAFSAEKGAGGHFDDRSIANMQLIASASKEAPNDALASLAYNTGGLWFHNSNDLDAGFHELGMRPEVSYLLGFSPGDQLNGKYHKLRVRLKTPGHNIVQARLGYMAVDAPKPEAQAVRRIDTLAAADTVMDEVPGALTTQPAQSNPAERGVMAVFHIDIKQLHFAGTDGVRQQKLSLIAMLLDAGGNFVTAKEGVVTLALKEPTFTAFSPDGMNFILTLPAPPGSYRLRAVMEEGVDGKASARTLPVEIR